VVVFAFAVYHKAAPVVALVLVEVEVLSASSCYLPLILHLLLRTDKSEPPYEVSEKGWGEFEALIDVFFRDKGEKPVELRHFIRLFHPVNQQANIKKVGLAVDNREMVIVVSNNSCTSRRTSNSSSSNSRGHCRWH